MVSFFSFKVFSLKYFSFDVCDVERIYTEKNVLVGFFKILSLICK